RATHRGVVDGLGYPVENAVLPQGDIPATQIVASGAHQPVVGHVLMLEHVPLAVDDDPLEAGARLRVLRVHRRTHPTTHEFVDRARDLASHYRSVTGSVSTPRSVTRLAHRGSS